MATSLVTFQSFRISASSSSDSSSRKLSSQGRGLPCTGWSLPNFGWSADQPDNRTDSRRSLPTETCSSGGNIAECGEDERNGRRYMPGNFTEDKAKQLRLMTTGLEMTHERMYHSAIASRLASDFSDRFNDGMI